MVLTYSTYCIQYNNYHNTEMALHCSSKNSSNHTYTVVTSTLRYGMTTVQLQIYHFPLIRKPLTMGYKMMYICDVYYNLLVPQFKYHYFCTVLHMQPQLIGTSKEVLWHLRLKERQVTDLTIFYILID